MTNFTPPYRFTPAHAPRLGSGRGHVPTGRGGGGASRVVGAGYGALCGAGRLAQTAAPGPEKKLGEAVTGTKGNGEAKEPRQNADRLRA